MNGTLTLILCFLIFITIVLAILFHDRVRNIKKKVQEVADARAARKQAEEDAYFKRTSNKYYHEEEEKPKFSNDYFKTKEKPKEKQPEQPQQETTTRRTVETSSGVTIIDDRADQQADRKIFNDSEGEYVDFVEVKS